MSKPKDSQLLHIVSHGGAEEAGVNSSSINHRHIKDTRNSNVIASSDDLDDDGRVRRKGNMWTASAHVITAVIGSGVLSLAWSMAQLGWIAGPLVLITFAIVTYFASLILADCYRSPDPVSGHRNYTYMDAVRVNLGGRNIKLCGLVQYSNLVGIAIGYTITASTSMVAIKRSNCFHQNGKHAACQVSDNMYMAMFGIIQLVLSQIPDFSNISWLSIVAAIMSFSYSFIGLGLGISVVAENGHVHGSKTGIRIGSVGAAQKTWSVFQAIGNVAFAYSFSNILIEIQDTLRSPPPENTTMKKATMVGIAVTTLFYTSVGCVGYAAFGDSAPGNLLTGFGFYNPYWLIDFANACIILHLVGAYQVFTQPVFAFVESWVDAENTKSWFVKAEKRVRVPYSGRTFTLSLFRLVWRSSFVVFTTIVSMLLPFFNDILGLLGAFSFWPLTIYFPIAMHVARCGIKRWTPSWIALHSLNAICFLVSLAAGFGSIVGVAQAVKHYVPFKA